MSIGQKPVRLTINGRVFDATLVDVKIDVAPSDIPALDLLRLQGEWTVPGTQLACQRCGRLFPLADAFSAVRHLCVPMNQSSGS